MVNSNLESVSLLAMVLAVIVIIAVSFLCNAQLRTFWYRSPGPWGIPLLGFYPFLRQDYHIQLAEMSKIYGDTYLLSLGGKLFVHLSSYKALREAVLTNSNCFSGRCLDFSPIQHLLADGLPFLNGEGWRVWRKFTGQSMRELGLSPKEPLNDSVLKSIQAILNTLAESQSQVIDISTLLSTECNKVSEELILGDRTSRNEIAKFNEAYHKGNTIMGSAGILLHGNIARYFILPWIKEFKNVLEARKGMDSALHAMVEEHKNNFDPENPKDFIDLYLREKKIREEKGDLQAKYFTDKALIGTMKQVYGDSGYGIGIFIAQILKDLASKENVQNAIYQEIVDEIGTKRLPVFEDQKRMPFTVSAIRELERMSQFFPVVPSVECSCDTILSGVFVPKGTVTLVNVYAIHKDPEAFRDPEQFNPKRFMPDEETNHPKEDLPLTFGIGKRSCAGELLVKGELFVFLTAIMQHFILRVETDASAEKSKPTVEEVRLIAVPRRESSTNKL